jgi:hypothetical protein
MDAFAFAARVFEPGSFCEPFDSPLSSRLRTTHREGASQFEQSDRKARVDAVGGKQLLPVWEKYSQALVQHLCQ